MLTFHLQLRCECSLPAHVSAAAAAAAQLTRRGTEKMPEMFKNGFAALWTKRPQFDGHLGNRLCHISDLEYIVTPSSLVLHFSLSNGAGS